MRSALVSHVSKLSSRALSDQLFKVELFAISVHTLNVLVDFKVSLLASYMHLVFFVSLYTHFSKSPPVIGREKIEISKVAEESSCNDSTF